MPPAGGVCSFKVKFMSYYKKYICIEVFLPVAVEAESKEKAKEIIENMTLDGKTVKIYSGLIRNRLNFEDDIPEKISKETYKKTFLKAKA